MIGTAFSLLVVLVGISLPVAVALGLMAYVLSERYAFFPMTGQSASWPGTRRTTSS